MKPQSHLSFPNSEAF